MPQMSPINWLNLMLIFMIMLTIMNPILFFSKIYKINIKSQTKTTINWKW